MKKIMTALMVMVFATLGMNAQSLLDLRLEGVVKEFLTEGTVNFSGDADYAGMVIVESATGNVIADVAIAYENGCAVGKPMGNNDYVFTGLGAHPDFSVAVPTDHT